MNKAKVGVVCLARTTFDYKAAGEIYQRTISDLRKINSVDWAIVEPLVISAQEAEAAALRLARETIDAVVIISGTFHLGHLALTIDKHVQRPILLWAFSELPYNGGKIRLNSVCGVNLNASNLYKAGRENFHCIIGDRIDLQWLDAVRMKAAVNGARVGLAGYRADGFFNLSVADSALFAKTGILVDHYELSSLIAAADRPSITEKEVTGAFNCVGLTAQQVSKTADLANAMEQFINSNELDALAVRCWPEFADMYGTSPCAAMSLLSAKGYTIGCEGDVEGTVSMLACNVISQLPAFLADLSQINFDEDCALMWHCGVAAPTLWDGASEKTLDSYFAAGRGVTAGFVMQSGTVTVMRIDSARGKTRLFVQKGEAIPMKKELTGTYCKVKFERPMRELFDTITQNGIAHHVALIYGDHVETVRHFAKMMEFELIQ